MKKSRRARWQEAASSPYGLLAVPAAESPAKTTLDPILPHDQTNQKRTRFYPGARTGITPAFTIPVPVLARRSQECFFLAPSVDLRFFASF